MTEDITSTPDFATLAAAFPAADEAQWRALAEKALRGASLDRLVSHTADGIEIQPLAGRITAGPRPARQTTGSWTALARIDLPDPSDANAQALRDMAGGAGGLHIVCATNATAYGFGVPADALESVLGDIDPANTALSLDPAPGDVGAARTLAAFVDSSGLNPSSASLSFGIDPFALLLRAGSDDVAFADAVQAAKELAARGFAGPFLCADARPIHSAGGSEAQELAFLLAGAVGCLRACETAGIAPDDARRWIGFRIAADADQFLTIAKLRALRRLLARLVDACGLAPEPAHVHADTAWRMTTRTDAAINVLRATVAAFSAVAGGADSVCVLPHTQALGLPDRTARRLARNIQLILAEESHLGQVDDPAGGAGGLEKLTDALCIKAWTLFQDIESQGGIAAALTSGMLSAQIAAVRETRLKDAATGRAPLTGTSVFPALEEAPADVLVPLPQGWRSGLAAGYEPFRPAAAFEVLRARASRLAEDGRAPKVFLANLGALAQFNARANFARNFFAAGAIEAVGIEGYADAAQLAEAFRASGARIACLCGADEAYRSVGAACATAMKEAGATHVAIAQRPGDDAEALRQAGVDAFVYQGCDMAAAIDDVLTKL